MTNSIFFLVGISLIIVHEMDAIRCKEWRILPGLSKLDDNKGQIIFILIHLPLFYLIFWELTRYPDIDLFRIGFDIFFIIHTALHLLYLKHKKNEFKDLISWVGIDKYYYLSVSGRITLKEPSKIKKLFF